MAEYECRVRGTNADVRECDAVMRISVCVCVCVRKPKEWMEANLPLLFALKWKCNDEHIGFCLVRSAAIKGGAYAAILKVINITSHFAVSFSRCVMLFASLLLADDANGRVKFFSGSANYILKW